MIPACEQQSQVLRVCSPFWTLGTRPPLGQFCSLGPSAPLPEASLDQPRGREANGRGNTGSSVGA